jgi:capsular polysaccharide biosynthesis protein
MTSDRTDKAPLEVEQEVDFGRYLRALGRGWWLLVAGLAVGAVVGYLLSLGGGGNVYRAKATVYLGQPLAAAGSSQIQNLNTNPSTVKQLVRSDALIEQVAADTDLKPGKLRSGVSVQTVQGSLSKLGQTPLVAISVKAASPRADVAKAANELAALVVDGTSGYARTKIATLKTQIAAQENEVAAIDRRLAALNKSLASGGMSATEQLVLLTAATLSEQRRGAISDELQQARLLLAQAQTVEQGRIVTRAVAVKATARSPRNSVIVGGALGLLGGALAALAVAAYRREPGS